MANITIIQVCNAVNDTLAPLITGLKRSQSMDELTEDYPSTDLPLLQTYWQGQDVDPHSVNSNRTTFKGGVITTVMTINADLIVRQRSQLTEDYTELASFSELFDQAIAASSILQPLFGLTGLKGLNYRLEPVTFQRGGGSEGGPSILYVGVRAILSLRIF